MHKEATVRLKANFSPETMEVRRQWNDIFKVLKGKKNYQGRILYLEKLSFKMKAKLKHAKKRSNLQEISLTDSLKYILKEAHQAEMGGNWTVTPMHTEKSIYFF